MALSYALRQALKNRTRRWRRVEVAMFFFWLLLGLVEGAGRPLSWGTVGIRSFPYIWAIGQIFGYWRRMRTLPVTSLDDRAMVEYGVEFEQLGEAEQKDLLRRYQVGTYMVNNFPDEREGAQEQGSQMRAYAMLRWLLPMLAAVYAVGWWVLPEGRVRNGWTNGPVVVTWLFLLVLALPQMIRMWTEPDEVGEPRAVVMEREA